MSTQGFLWRLIAREAKRPQVPTNSKRSLVADAPAGDLRARRLARRGDDGSAAVAAAKVTGLPLVTGQPPWPVSIRMSP
jgi:hypothetical protein